MKGREEDRRDARREPERPGEEAADRGAGPHTVNTAGLESGIVPGAADGRSLPGGGVPEGRSARAVWILSAVMILSLVTFALWFFSRSYAPAGAVWDTEQRLDGTDGPSPAVGADEASPSGGAAPEEDVPAALSDAGTADTSPEDPAGASSDGGDNIVYYRRRNDNMEIALSFDDGPHPRYTAEILSILAEYGVQATFFMVGENVRYYPEAAAAVLAAGHEIGNHSTTHKRLSGLPEADVRREITGCEEALASLGEYRPHLLRPPEGSLSRTVRRLSGEMDYRLILWDIDTRDWAHTPPDEIARNILDNVQAGDIILMHDYIGRDSPTPEALRLVLPELLRRGYRFVTVSRLIDGA